MAVKIELKRSAIPGKVPTVSQLDLGELAINTYDGTVYFKQDTTVSESIIQLATTAGSGSAVVSASHADNADFAISSSYANFATTAGSAISSSYSLSGSYAQTASFALNTGTASYVLSASYAISASWAPNQEFVTGSVTSASYASTASYVFLEELALSSGYVNDAQAAAAGVPIGGIYRNGNFIQIRIS
jgi:hypothetical protein